MLYFPNEDIIAVLALFVLLVEAFQGLISCFRFLNAELWFLLPDWLQSVLHYFIKVLTTSDKIAMCKAFYQF